MIYLSVFRVIPDFQAIDFIAINITDIGSPIMFIYYSFFNFLLNC